MTKFGQIRSEYIETGKVRFVYKYRVVFGEESLLADEAAEAAAEQNMFWTYRKLIESQDSLPKGAEAVVAILEKLAQSAGLDMPRFKASLESGEFKDEITKEDTDAQAQGIDNTPTFFINSVSLIGDVSMDEFREAIDSELQKVGR